MTTVGNLKVAEFAATVPRQRSKPILPVRSVAIAGDVFASPARVGRQAPELLPVGAIPGASRRPDQDDGGGQPTRTEQKNTRTKATLNETND
jgi:hypothetical protein